MSTHKTLFIPATHGQFRLWKKDIAPACNTVDKVIHLGSLIGCNQYSKDKERMGPNNAILNYVRFFRSTSDNWVHIVGRNEIAALNLPKEWTNADSRKMLRDIWFGSEDSMFVATHDKGRLVTHGGLTYGEWVSIGKPSTAEEAAALINEKYHQSLYQGPCLALGSAPNFSANPIWADPIHETYPSWITAPEEMPFDQVHGSSNLYLKENRDLLNNKDSILSYADNISFAAHHSTVTVKDRTFISTDLGLEGPILKDIPSPKALYVEVLRTGENS